MLPPKVHYLRPNHTERSPHALLVWDTETRTVGEGPQAFQVLRLWCADLVIRRNMRRREAPLTRLSGVNADTLADAIEDAAAPKRALWCYAHNLGFDLSVTALPVVLAERGWKLTAHALATEQPWARMSKGDLHIVLCDSWSLMPEPLADIGARVGIAKPDLPENDDSEAAWVQRCQADVQITRTALLQVLDWWDAQALGNWSLTGPACGWSSLRHREDFGKVVIDPDNAARAEERAAISGGRREVWRVGKQQPGLYADLDFLHAHLTVCATKALPWRRGLRIDSLPTDHLWLQAKTLDVLAEVEIETATPRYPVDTGNGILYPTGRFVTTLAGPEIREAAARGELRRVGKGYVYDVRPHMAGWARWVAAMLDAPGPDLPPAVGAVAKAWSRTVPGKWAAHTGETAYELPDPRPGWHLEEGAIMPGRIPARYLSLGGTQYVIAMDREADDAFPAVLAWVQSWTRVLLSRLVDGLGDACLQCNTDGALVDVAALIRTAELEGWAQPGWWRNPGEAVQAAIGRLAPAIDPLTVRVKRLAQEVDIIGPQHIVLDKERRLAGVPRKALEPEPHVYSFDTWPRLPSQIGRDGPAGYQMGERTISLQQVPVARWRLTGGMCLPPECRLTADGANEILPPPRDLFWAGVIDLEQPEHPALRGLLARGLPVAEEIGVGE